MDVMEMLNWSYIPDLPPYAGSIRDLLHDYSEIPVHDVDNHLFQIVSRSQWALC